MSLVEMQAHYKAVRQRLMNPVKLSLLPLPSPPLPPPSPPEPEHQPEIAKAESSRIAAMEAEFRRIGEIPTIRRIQAMCCLHFNVTPMDMISARRAISIVWPRQVAMWLCRELTLKSYPEIGRRFGGRDHTTVIHAYTKVAERRLSDFDFREELEELVGRARGER